MNHTLIIILGTLAIYLALFVHVAFSPKFSKKLIAAAGAVVIVCGLVFYSICFSSAYDNLGLAILRTCHAVLQLFIGENPLEIIGDSPLLERPVFQIASSALGFLGVFTTAGAALSAIGAGLLRKLRLFFQRKQDVAIIQPLNNKTLSFARELNAQKKTIVVFVDENPDASCVDAAQEFGSVIRSDDDAITGSPAFVWSLGIGKAGRKLALYALDNNQFANRQYACRLADSLQQQGIPAVQTSLTIFANEDETQNTIMSADGSYTYGSILCVSQEILAAHTLAGNVEKLCAVVALGLASTASIIIGREIGAGRIPKVHSMARALSVLGFGCGLVMASFLLVFDLLGTRFIFAQFNLSPAAASIAFMMIAITACYIPLRNLNSVLVIGVMRGGGDVRTATLIDIGPMWFCSIPYAIVCATLLKTGIFWVYLAYALEQVVKTIFGLRRLRSGKWVRDITVPLD